MRTTVIVIDREVKTAADAASIVLELLQCSFKGATNAEAYATEHEGYFAYHFSFDSDLPLDEQFVLPEESDFCVLSCFFYPEQVVIWNEEQSGLRIKVDYNN